jgi:uncharacterized protein YbjT (DUF2867 family)
VRMPKTILVTGAAGTLGRRLLPSLVAAGHGVRALSRRQRAVADARVTWVVGDLRGGAGLDPAVAGVEVIVHCASSQRGDLIAAQHLLDAARRAGAPHVLYISIVGVDRMPVGYYKVKLSVERLLAESGLPFTILRATQFHDLVLRMFTAQRWLPLLLVPARSRFQPVDVADVADRLATLAGAEAAGRVPDLGGPAVLDSAELASRYLRATGRHRRIAPIRVPGTLGRGVRSGANLAPEHADGRGTFDEFLLTLTASATSQ